MSDTPRLAIRIDDLLRARLDVAAATYKLPRAKIIRAALLYAVGDDIDLIPMMRGEMAPKKTAVPKRPKMTPAQLDALRERRRASVEVLGSTVCPHPENARLGHLCGRCGATIVAKPRG